MHVTALSGQVRESHRRIDVIRLLGENLLVEAIRLVELVLSFVQICQIEQDSDSQRFVSATFWFTLAFVMSIDPLDIFESFLERLLALFDLFLGVVGIL